MQSVNQACASPSPVQSLSILRPPDLSVEDEGAACGITSVSSLLPALNLFLVILLSILCHTAFNGSRLTVTLYAHHLGASTFTIGVLMAMYAIVPMLSAVAFGRMIDRIGFKRPLLFSAITLVLALGIGFFWRDLWAMVVLAVLMGTAFMVFHVAINSLVGAMGSEENRAVRFSWLALGFSVSGFLGPVASGFSIDHWSHPLTFALLGIGPVITVVALLGGALKLPRASLAGKAATDRNVMDLVRNPDLRPVFIVTALLSMGWDLFMFVVPIHCANLGFSASVIGGIMGAFAAATFAVRMVLPHVAKRVREWHLITFSFVMATLAYALFPFFKTAPLMAALAFLLGLGLGCSQPMLMSILYTKSPPGRAGEAVGVRSTLLNASHTGLPLLFGGVGAALGMMPVFFSMALMLGFGGWYAKRRMG